jgi:putative MFS transporter
MHEEEYRKLDDETDLKTNEPDFVTSHAFYNENEPYENDDGPTYTFDDALDHIGVGIFQILLLCICGGGWFLDGVYLGIVSFILPTLTIQWNLSPVAAGALGSAVFLGMMFGAYFGGIISDAYGRKAIFLWAIFWTTLVGIANALAPEQVTFIILRILIGLGLGASVPTDLSVLLEFVPRNHRGIFMGLMNIFWSAGAIYVCVLAWATLTTLDVTVAWKYFVGLSAIPGILIFISRLLVPESPRFYMVTGQMDKAFQILRDVAKFNGKSPPEGRLVFHNVDHTTQKNIIRQVLQLFSPSLRRTTILLLIIWFGLSYGSWGFAFLIPIEFSNTNNNTFRTSNVYTMTLAVIAVGIIGFLAVSLIMDRIGRRPLLAVTFFIAGILTSCIAISSNSTFVLIIAIFVNFVSCFPWAVLYTYTPEVFPTVVRATGMGTCSAFTRLAGTITPLVGEVLLRENRIYPFVSFGIALLISAICSALLPIETLGRVLQDGVDDSGSMFDDTTVGDKPFIGNEDEYIQLKEPKKDEL